MRTWEVRLVYSRNLGAGNDELAPTLSKLAADLAEYQPLARGGHEGLTVTLVVSAPDHAVAVNLADTLVRQAAADYDIEPGDISEAHAKTWD